jgi:hypothetical protein
MVSQSAWVHSNKKLIFCFHLLGSMCRFYAVKIFSFAFLIYLLNYLKIWNEEENEHTNDIFNYFNARRAIARATQLVI